MKRLEIDKDEMKEMIMKERIGNLIGDEGTRTIIESLEINTSLTKLALGGDEMITNENERKE